MKMILFLLLSATFFGLAACQMENQVITAENQSVVNPPPPPATNKTPVLVELFTSEG
jgi:hypothetical protein